MFGGPTDHTAKAETFLKRDPFRSKPSLTGDCWGGGGFKATSFITVGLGKRGGSPRLVRLWLSCMEYHFQPLFDVQRWPLIYFSFFFSLQVAKVKNPSQLQDHYFTAIESLFNPPWGSFCLAREPETMISSPLDLGRRTRN